MRALLSGFGAVLAVLYALAFGAAYHEYLTGGWLAGAWLFAVALPYTATMVALTGGVDFSGESIGAVLTAAAACCAAAYVAGALLESALRAMFRLFTRRA